MNGITLASDNLLFVRRNRLKIIQKIIIINEEKLQYDINKEAAKISTLSSGKIGK